MSMSNVKISPKGKALLQERYSAEVAKAIVRGGNALLEKGGIRVPVGERHSVVLKLATAKSSR